MWGGLDHELRTLSLIGVEKWTFGHKEDRTEFCRKYVSLPPVSEAFLQVRTSQMTSRSSGFC